MKERWGLDYKTKSDQKKNTSRTKLAWSQIAIKDQAQTVKKRFRIESSSSLWLAN